MAAFCHADSNHSPHLLIRICKMPHTCPVLPPYQSLIFAILLWSHGNASLFYFGGWGRDGYAHQDRRVCSQWLFKWMQALTNVSLSIKKFHMWLSELYKLQFCVTFAFLKSKPDSELKAGGTTTAPLLQWWCICPPHFSVLSSCLYNHQVLIRTK